ncbi:MAG: hypothetical protein GX304_03725 [Clostridiales bacterium]|nr:hypothetical protein [Clostridiales bacterium]
MQSKDLSLIGFAVKARKVVFGLNQIKSCKKRVCLMFICHTASQSTQHAALSLAKKRRAAALRTRGVPLEDVVGKPNCKSAAITDETFAAAIMRNVSHQFEIIGREDNNEREG